MVLVMLWAFVDADVLAGFLFRVLGCLLELHQICVKIIITYVSIKGQPFTIVYMDSLISLAKL